MVIINRDIMRINKEIITMHNRGKCCPFIPYPYDRCFLYLTEFHQIEKYLIFSQQSVITYLCDNKYTYKFQILAKTLSVSFSQTFSFVERHAMVQ